MIALRDAGAERVAAVWNASAGAKYAITADLVSLNLFDSPLLHEAASAFSDDAFVAIKRNASSLYSGPDLKTAHLSLVAGRPDDLLRHAIRVLRSEGVTSLVVGTDSGHFLPGAPTDIEWLGPWLESHGFEAGGEAVDLESDLSNYLNPAKVIPADYRTLTSDDVPALESFLLREFPGRWHYDVMQKIRVEGPRTVFSLFIDGECQGFALLQGEGCQGPIGGAVWKSDLGPSWGSLGPIGVSKGVRGKGYGNALLGEALTELRNRGARRSIIDWTGLVDFYGAHGFRVARGYRANRLDLAADPQP